MKWDSEKLLASALGKGAGKVSRVRAHPTDNTVLTTSGPMALKLWRLGGTGMQGKEMSQAPARPENRGKVLVSSATQRNSLII